MDTTTRPGFVPGIDVSHHNGLLNWANVARLGLTFAYAKATEGLAFQDNQFAANWSNMKAAGIRRGAYHFFHPGQSPEQQADFFLKVVSQWDPADLPPVLDIEETGSGTADEWPRIPPAQRVSLILRWLLRVQAQLGRKPMIYTRHMWVTFELPNPGPLATYPLWLAEYSAISAPHLPNGWAKWTFWQHSQRGALQGIPGAFDLNWFNGSPEDLEAFCAPAPEIPGPPATA